MRSTRLLIALIVVMVALAQTRVDVARQAKGIGHLEPPFSSPIRSGPDLPASCDVGELFFLTSAPAGANLQVCHGTNAWASQGSAGQANVTVYNGGTLVGTGTNINFSAGTGMLYLSEADGGTLNVHSALNTAVVATKPFYQSGSGLLCASTAPVAGAHSCVMSPALTAYGAGLVVHWLPESSATGAPLTLDIDTLGPKAILLPDGLSNPAAGDIAAGQLYILWYDGASFRVMNPNVQTGATPGQVQGGQFLACASSTTIGTAFTCNLNPELSAYEAGIVLHWIPDVDAEGPTTLDVDGIGAVAIKLANGVSDPSAGDIQAGQIYPIWFDGTHFRRIGETPSARTGLTRPPCSAATRGRIWVLEAEASVADEAAICVKDANDTYGWQVLYE